MPRRARLILPDISLHIIQRGNNRPSCFFADGDYSVYLDWPGEHASKTCCRIHSYVLMTNHVHLLISADRVEAPGLLMKAMGK
jgi:putative transposase